ncbi:MAG TPA: ribosomal protein S18-alanine N-acetyltransferase [Gemmatimonadales bacterium]|jgi:ribosomal-protein-alanine N-acetyltransferase|nr:ribosomal protein S18-alanine N-acetyltransferase [Gemmatimonadales bacterium]
MAVLERASFSDPWSPRSLEETIGLPGMLALVAVDGDDRLLGYLFGRELAGEAEVLNVAVAPAARRGGVGRALLTAALAWFAGRGAGETFLEVRASNQAAIALYEGAGFRAVGRRPGYYQHPTEDAVLYRRPGSREA